MSNGRKAAMLSDKSECSRRSSKLRRKRQGMRWFVVDPAIPNPGQVCDLCDVRKL